MKRPKILLLSSSLLVDRVFVHTNLIETLAEYGEVFVWAVSRGDEKNSPVWDSTAATAVEAFPLIKPFREIPHNYLRRLNDFAWDYRFRIPGRLSMQRHVRDKSMPRSVLALKLPGRIMATLHAEQWFEDRLEQMMLKYPRSTEAERRLCKMKPTVIVVTGAFQYEQPAIFAAAKKLSIPTLAYIPSWDNITTKGRPIYKYDGYLVWSEQTKRELRQFYPAAADAPVYVTGAPQFDLFYQQKFYETRAEFCERYELNSDLPLIVYALGSPNFLQEHHGAVEMAKRVVNGELGDVQMLVRPHPIHDNNSLSKTFDRFAPRVRLQLTHNAGKRVAERSQDEQQIREWINTFRHADVVINLSSTVTIDAAIFDKPVINLDFDPQPGAAHKDLIDEINHQWLHFKPVAESGGVYLVKNFDELTAAVKNYLQNPALDRAERKWIVRHVCQHADGKCSERMARAIADFAGLCPQSDLSKRRLQPIAAVVQL